MVIIVRVCQIVHLPIEGLFKIPLTLRGACKSNWASASSARWIPAT